MGRRYFVGSLLKRIAYDALSGWTQPFDKSVFFLFRGISHEYAQPEVLPVKTSKNLLGFSRWTALQALPHGTGPVYVKFQIQHTWNNKQQILKSCRELFWAISHVSFRLNSACHYRWFIPFTTSIAPCILHCHACFFNNKLFAHYWMLFSRCSLTSGDLGQISKTCSASFSTTLYVVKIFFLSTTSCSLLYSGVNVPQHWCNKPVVPVNIKYLGT